jgi:hypothetical protein
MARPRSRTPAQEKWIADLVNEHGPREAARLSTEQGVKVDPSKALRMFQEHYPGQSADPTVRAEAVMAGEAPQPPRRAPALAPPVTPEHIPDKELLAAARSQDPEVLLQAALERILGLVGSGGSPTTTIKIIESARALVTQISKMRREAQAMRGRRLGVLVLPAEGAEEVAA